MHLKYSSAHDPVAEGERLSAFGSRRFGGYPVWADAPDFEKVMKPRIVAIRTRCGPDYAEKTLENANVVGVTWRALLTWATP